MTKMSVLAQQKFKNNSFKFKTLNNIKIHKDRTLHPYFTSQPSSLVQKYVETFSKADAKVLDPFCGSGVTAIESLTLGRQAIAIDLSPLACFVTKVSITKIENYENVFSEFKNIEKHCREQITDLYKLSQHNVELLNVPYWYPKRVRLPKNSDVEYVENLFTKRNLVALAILKHNIENINDLTTKNFFRLIFSGILHRASRTFFYDKAHWGGGNSSIFTKYRYWVPPKPDERNVWNLFEIRFKRILKAKQKLDSRLPNKPVASIINGTATNMNFIDDRSIDYIYTDPPYGANIAYLDLSTIWSAWLNFGKSDLEWLKFGTDRDAKKFEVIEGGDICNTKEKYLQLLTEALRDMYRVLKYNSVLSIAFCHKNLKFWDSILNACEYAGFEYKNAYLYSSYYRSFHKIKNPLSVLSGQLVLNFVKVKNPRPISTKLYNFIKLPNDVLRENVEKIILENNGNTTTEIIINRLIPRLLERGLLNKYKELDFVMFLKNNFDFDENSGIWAIK